jgi:hypothetical protein
MDAATQHARGLDTQGYYTKAMQSPLGQQVRNFYTSTSKQILDIHEEASRISSQQKEKAAKDAVKNSQPVELKANTTVSGGSAPAPDAAKASGPTESKADTAISGNPSTAPDAA